MFLAATSATSANTGSPFAVIDLPISRLLACSRRPKTTHRLWEFVRETEERVRIVVFLRQTPSPGPGWESRTGRLGISAGIGLYQPLPE